MTKLAILEEKGTNGVNYDLSNEAIIKLLQSWDTHYGIDVSEVEHDTVTVRFLSLPDDVEALAHEIDAVCPDVIDQGFGSMPEMVDFADQMGHVLPDEVQQLIEGIDLDSDECGMALLTRSLRLTNTVKLWWD